MKKRQFLRRNPQISQIGNRRLLTDILDERYVPNHGTKEPNGPDIAQVKAAIRTVMATGKVAALAVVSVYGEGKGSHVSVASGIELISAGLEAWRQYGLPAVLAER